MSDLCDICAKYPPASDYPMVGSYPVHFDDGAVRWRCHRHAEEAHRAAVPNPRPSMPRSDRQYHGGGYQP